MMRCILKLLKRNFFLLGIIGVVGVGMTSGSTIYAELWLDGLADHDVSVVQKAGGSNIITEAREECRQDVEGQARKLKDDYSHLGVERDERYVKCTHERGSNHLQACSDEMDRWKSREKERLESEFRQLKEGLKECET